MQTSDQDNMSAQPGTSKLFNMSNNSSSPINIDFEEAENVNYSTSIQPSA